ncbi:chemotaxis protein CheW, partial [Staphylococcus coagulans]
MQAANANGAETGPTDDYVTVFVGDTLFGLAIERVHDVFVPSGVTPVPLAPSEIVGLLNLRGRVVTAVCLRRRLGLPDAVVQD